MDAIKPGDHLAYMRKALSLAERSPPKPTNFRVGALLVDATENRILATGYTLERPGNTHAEQCCLANFAEACNVSESSVADVLPAGCVLYTTVEPCEQRLSGNKPCVERIIDTKNGKHGGIATVYVGVWEPDTFIAQNAGRAKLESAGVPTVLVPGLEDEILKVAKTGHKVT